jgi:D-galactarolactone cycloisomerase
VKIEQVRILPLVENPPAEGWPEGYLPARNDYTLVEILTDTGLVGLGSAYTSARLVDAAVEFLRPMLIGESASEPARVAEKLHQSTFWQGRGGAVTHAISGIDIALWDLFGQETGQPISRLLGGRYREKVKPYASMSLGQPEKLAGLLRDAMERGFSAAKIGWGPLGRVSRQRDEELVRTARNVLGPDIDLMVDPGASAPFWQHGYKWALETAKMLRDYDVAWFEEPLRPDDIESYVKLTENAPVPISACEVLTRRQSFTPWIERRAIDYVQPDLTKVGGLTEAHRIAMHAYDHSIMTIPHGWNTAVGLAADLQLMAAVPTAQWVEYKTPSPFIDELVETPLAIDDEGFLEIPSGPGLGIVWSREGVRKLSGMELTAI